MATARTDRFTITVNVEPDHDTDGHVGVATQHGLEQETGCTRAAADVGVDEQVHVRVGGDP